jgi:hypothetical protein
LGGTPKTIAWLASGQKPEAEPPALLRWGQNGLEKGLEKGLANRWSRKKITKKAHAGRLQEPKWELSIQIKGEEPHDENHSCRQQSDMFHVYPARRWFPARARRASRAGRHARYYAKAVRL